VSVVLRRWLRDPRSLRESVLVARDERAFRAHRTTFATGSRAPSAPRALAVSLSGWPYQLKIEGILLKGLEVAGYRGAIVTDRGGASRARRYMRTFSLETLPLERYADSDHDDPAELLDGDLSVQRLKSLRYRGANVGQHVLSTLSRRLRRGSVALDDDEARSLVAELLPRSMALVRTAERLLDDIRPDVLIFNEARYAGFGPIFETALARGLDVVQFVHAFSDDALVFKRYTTETSRVNPRSLGNAAWREVLDGPWTEQMEAELWQQFERRYTGMDALSRRMYSHTRSQSADELTTSLELDPNKQTAVVFSHVLWDANLFYGDDLFDDQEAWLVESVRAAAGNDRLNWVVKLHPANVWKRKLERVTGELPEVSAIARHVGNLPRHVRVLRPESDVSARSLFDLADYVVTIRGTVGMEAPCFGIPAVTAGTGHYSGRGFTLDSANADEYLERLGRLHEVPPLGDDAVLRARKHAHALFCRRPMPFTSFRSVIDPEGRGGLMSHRLAIEVSTAEEVRRAADLRTFADWIRSGQEDYLAPLER
jgi:Capsule polysaccharide biosynthesis protein